MPPRGRNASLVKAKLTINRPPAGVGGRLAEVEFQFNPSQLQMSRSASWHTQPAVAYTKGATPEFAGVTPATLEVEVFLDASDRPAGSKVQQQVDRLLSCCEVEPQSIAAKKPAPPWVRFSWGSFTTPGFAANVQSVNATYTLFSPTGEPLRATCQLSLSEIPLPTKGQNPTSGARSATRVHRVVAGDSLASVAWREYGDPTLWRAVARANDIDDPMRLTIGSELLLPSAGEIK
ncbi:LysM peptidoglycan-binding domain-containing protein [Cryptosporangium arvum]|jgi:nucleoid-associated protein YgaU|uniref:CIS tube protein n=1 Tax=Cryptosporangium arvum TaxID=80871 RepID=UPI0004B12626|nr:LysM peptidoglycan-binding domain-containing protein [Cryptosporangium arvum]